MGMFDMSYKDVEDGAIGVDGKKKKTLAPEVPAQKIPVAQPAQGISAPPISLGAGQPPTIYGNGGLPADVVQRGIDTMRSQLATPQVAQPAQAIAETGAVKPVDTNRPWYAGTDSRDERTGLEMERARRGEATQAGVLNDPVKSAIQYGVVGNPLSAPAINATAAAVTPEAMQSPQKFSAQSAVTQLPDSGMGFMTGAEPGKAPAPFIKPGFNANGVVTAESAKAAMGADMQRSGGIAGGIDLAAANAVDQRANNVRQQMIDAQVGGGTGKPVSWQDQHGNADPEKQRIADSNALLNKWDKQYQNGQMIAEMGRNPRAAQGIAQLAAAAGHDETVMRDQDIAATNAANGDMTTRRGQDVSAKNEAAKLAGNPQEQQLKQAQAQGIMAHTDTAKMMADLEKKAIAGDANALATYRALTTKAKDGKYSAHVVGGGVNELGQAQPQYLGVTGSDGSVQFHRPGQQGQQAQAPASFDAYAKAVREANAGRTLSDAELKAKYDAKYGAQK